ncbi:MAG: pilus assembly protein PilP [Desulfonauticus sp.]|nr:pilus assembly protein PilP [Desulfonauticus sp.]
MDNFIGSVNFNWLGIIRKLWSVFFISCIVWNYFCLAGGLVWAKSGKAEPVLQSTNLPDWLKPPVYHYDPKGKVDPFVPFVDRVNRAFNRSQKRHLTPLERIDVTQLRLEGILWSSDPHLTRAVVELPDGKCFILKQGTVVGQNDGRVIKITPDKVIVKEKVMDIFGNLKNREVILKLHSKQGEEG